MIKFRAATKADDNNIKTFLDNYPSEGSVQIHLKRDSSFFDSIEVLGKNEYVLLLEDDDHSQLGGVGLYSEKDCYLNGQLTTIGYLSDLRLDPRFRNRGYLARGYKRIKEHVATRSIPFSLTTIMADNDSALELLTSRRANLPIYQQIATYETIFLGTKRNFWTKKCDLEVSRLKIDEIDEVVNFLSSVGSKRQFFPKYSKEDILQNEGMLRGLNYSDIFVARMKGEIVGTLALWNQMPFRRWVIKKYDRKVALFRFFYNIYARLFRTLLFPRMGEAVEYRNLSMIAIKDDSVDIFESILAHIWDSDENIDNLDLIMCGLASNDPLKQVLDVPGHRFKSRVLIVHWDINADHFDTLGDRIPFFELGSL